MSASTGNAPVALFVYGRLDHTRRTVEALAKNHGAPDTDLIVFSDAAKNPGATAAVHDVRSYLRAIRGFRSVRIIEREANLGLAKSIIGGVTAVLGERERVIVVEDDLVTSPWFLRYMNDGLEEYASDDRVISIHGYVYPVSRLLPETFFLRGADCWGWATWRRGWKLFDPDGQRLLNDLRSAGLTGLFDFDRTFDYTAMLQGQIDGTNDSWAVRWYASAFLQGRLTLYPGRSLVQNIGNDSTGSHSPTTDRYEVVLSPTPVRIGGISVEESAEGRRAFVDFGRQGAARPSLRSVMGRVLRLLTGGR